jgi:hypothetical protein
MISRVMAIATTPSLNASSRDVVDVWAPRSCGRSASRTA